MSERINTKAFCLSLQYKYACLLLHDMAMWCGSGTGEIGQGTPVAR